MPDDNVPKYYAVPNPDTGDMTYWERTKDGQYVAWPRKPRAAWYGPPMPSRKEQAQHEDIGAFGRHWWETIRKPWMDTVIAAIEADPVAAHARFAAFSTRCFVCGKTLTDDDSKVWGVGPVCQTGLPAPLLEATAREIGRLHAQSLT